MNRKHTLLELLQQAYYEEKVFYGGLSEEEKNRQGEVGDWAAKDITAHCAYWKQFRVADIQKVVDGGTIRQIDDFEHENAQIFEQFRDSSWEEVMAYAEKAMAVLTDQLEQMSNKDLELEWHDGRPIWRAVVGNAYSHPLMHISEYYQHKGDMQRAAEIVGLMGEPMTALDDSPSWAGTVRYNVACSYALQGRKVEAIEELAQALSLYPQIAEWSQQDPDLESLRDSPAYQRLYE